MAVTDWKSPGTVISDSSVGDTWKNVTKVQVNIGDTWKTVF